MKNEYTKLRDRLLKSRVLGLIILIIYGVSSAMIFLLSFFNIYIFAKTGYCNIKLVISFVSSVFIFFISYRVAGIYLKQEEDYKHKNNLK